MSIENTRRNDSGLYEITLKNDYGQDQRNGTIEVLDKPNKPKNLIVKLILLLKYKKGRIIYLKVFLILLNIKVKFIYKK